MKKMHIAFLDEGKGIGGAESNLIEFLKILKQDRHTITVICDYKKPLAARIDQLQVEASYLRLPPFLPTSFTLSRWTVLNPLALLYDAVIVVYKAVRLRYILSQKKIDLLQTNGMFEHIYGGLACRFNQTLCVWFMQDIPRGTFSFFTRAVINILAKLLADRIVAVSQAVKASFYPLLSMSIKVIHVGVDANRYREISSAKKTEFKKTWLLDDGSYLIGMSGRLVPWKGSADFIRAAALVSKKRKDAKFLIIGDTVFGRPEYKDYLLRLCDCFGLNDKMVFTGFLRDITVAMGTLDIFVHCPYYPDPCPLGVIEAAALGKAIIASNIGGIPEIITSQKEGVLVSPGDIEAIARSIESLIESPERRQYLGQMAQAKICKYFTIDRQVKDFKKIYDDSFAVPK